MELVGKKIHQPTERQCRAHERTEDFGAVNKPLARSVFGQNPEDNGHEEGKNDESGKVCQSHDEFSDE